MLKDAVPPLGEQPHALYKGRLPSVGLRQGVCITVSPRQVTAGRDKSQCDVPWGLPSSAWEHVLCDRGSWQHYCTRTPTQQASKAIRTPQSHDTEQPTPQAPTSLHGCHLDNTQSQCAAHPAGLWGEVSLAKGCYMGQETLAKVYNLNATRRRLAGLRMSMAAAMGTPVMLGAAFSVFLSRLAFWRLQCRPLQGWV